MAAKKHLASCRITSYNVCYTKLLRLSTKIERLGKLDLGINLAISLHAVDDELRQKLMPINKAYNIKSIIDAVKNFPVNARKRVMFEYLVIKDVNDSIDAAKKLLKLLVITSYSIHYTKLYELFAFSTVTDGKKGIIFIDHT